MNLKVKAVILTVLLTCIPPSSISFASDTSSPAVVVDTETVKFDQSPVIVEGRTLVPFRQILESLGGSASWDAGTQTVIANRGNMTVKLTINSDQAIVNGSIVKLDVPAQIVNSRTMVPLRFVSENLGAEAIWHGDQNTIEIHSVKSPGVRYTLDRNGDYQAMTDQQSLPSPLPAEQEFVEMRNDGQFFVTSHVLAHVVNDKKYIFYMITKGKILNGMAVGTFKLFAIDGNTHETIPNSTYSGNLNAKIDSNLLYFSIDDALQKQLQSK